MGSFQQAGLFLINTLFDFYLILLLLRLILQYLRVDYYNPITQFIVKFTNPVIIPLRRTIPGYWGVDLATVVIILLFAIIKTFLIAYLSLQRMPLFLGLFIWTFGDLIKLVINLFFYSILLSVLLSWVAPRSYSPVSTIVYRLTEPLLRPARRLIPMVAGFDISPIPVMLVLQLMIILLASPLIQMGFHLSVR